jgi:protein-L-isoaspartate O-methyltransferase
MTRWQTGGIGCGIGFAVATTAMLASAAVYQSDQKPASEVLAKAVREASVAAYERGLADALRTNPPSMDLEMVCVNLWANKQPVPND